jgi:hypothetical protein
MAANDSSAQRQPVYLRMNLVSHSPIIVDASREFSQTTA